MKISHCLASALLITSIVSLSSSQEKAPLKVLTIWPTGQTEGTNQTQTVVATFNKPMVPVHELPEGDGSGPLAISPSKKGKYRWLGTSTLAFTPSEPFEIATEYRVTIPAGTASLDGSSLSSEVSWTFSTPRPTLLGSRPGHASRGVDINAPLLLQFNQTMDPSAAESFIKFFEEKRGGSQIRFAVRFPSQEEMRKQTMYVTDSSIVLQLKPTLPLKRGKKYIVVISAGLTGAKGKLGTAKEASFSFETYQPFAFMGIDNSIDRNPKMALTFRFNNPVVISEFAKQVKFNPTLAVPEEYSAWTWSSTDISIQLPLQPQTKYSGTVSKELKDVFGQALSKEGQFAFNTVSFEPGLYMTTGHGIIESYSDRMYPVTVVNTDAMRVQMLRLSQETLVSLLRSDTIYARHLELSHSFDIDKTEELRTKPDKQSTVGVKLSDALIDGTHGSVLLQVSSVESDPYAMPASFFRADVQVTEMGLTAKFSPEDILIWLTTLKEAAPVGDASVQVRDDSNRVLWKGRTNSEGFVSAPGWGKFENVPRPEWSAPRLWVIASRGNDMAYTSSTWSDGIEPYRFNISVDWNPQHEPWQGSIFTDRGIYRPGEEVAFKGIFRSRRRGDWAVASGEVIVKIRDAQNEQVFADSAKVNEFGSLAFTFKIPRDSRLGYYTIDASLRTKGDVDPYRTIAAESFRVEAYRVSEFEVSARLNEKGYIVGDTARGSFMAKYLFGGAMKGEKVRWRLRYDPTWYAPTGWESYSFGRSFWSYQEAAGPQSKLLFTKDTLLSAKGTLDTEVKTQIGDVRATGNLVLEADVTSPSRQTISGRTSAILHAGEYYIGVRANSTFISKDSTLRFSIATVTPEGKVVTGENLSCKIFKREWHSVRKASPQGGFAWESEAVDTTLETFQLTSEREPSERTFSPKRSGLYVIEVSGKDRRGNEIASDTYFYASGSDYVAWSRSDDDRIELIADATKYEPGQTAKIIVKNPYEEATALVSIEREGVLKYWRTVLKGSAPEISVPLDNRSLPNVFVSVILLQGRMTKKPELDQTTDLGRPSFKIGYIELNVDPGTRHLSLSTQSDKQNYRPGDSVLVNLVVKDAAGKPARTEVVVSVADKGTLNLIGYRLPDPFDTFYGPRPLSVVTTESRLQIVQSRSFGEKGEDEGGGGGADLAGIETRGNFKSTAYWNAYLQTDSSGMLSFSFKLPDNLTTFKIMCVAQTKDSEFGYGENSFTVSKPLLLQPSLPRFTRLGDSFEAGAVVHNYTNEKGTVRLRTSSEGVHFKGKETMEFSLEAGESKELRQTFVANKVGKATFTFQAKMGNEADGLVVSIPIQVPRRKETIADLQAVQASSDLKLIVPENSHPGLGSVEMTASSTALSGLNSSIDYLFTYPYGCLEQKCSSILPIILGKEMVESFGLQPLRGKNAKAVVNAALREIRKYQIWSGGFTYWHGNRYDSPYASAFAMYVLTVAKKRGYAVDDQTIKRGTEYIKGVLRWQENMPAYPYTHGSWAGTKTLILYTLALLGKPEPAYYETYYKNLEKVPLFARATLLRAIASSTKNKSMMRKIEANLLNNIKMSPTSAHFEEPNIAGLEWCWSSNTRTTGIILQALLESSGFSSNKADLPAKIVKWLMNQKKSGRWSSTQENVYVVDALATYYRKFEKEEPKFKAEIRLAAENILSTVFEGRSLKTERASSELDKFEKGKELPLLIKKEGTGTLYAGIRMSYYPTDAAHPADEGIAVTKTIEPIHQNGKRDPRTFSAGSLLKVTLRIISPQQRSFVVVEDPLPAGLEAVNTSLQTESSEAGRLLADIQSQEYRYRWWGSFNFHELHDDKVLVFADQLDAGVHTFTYLARAMMPGKYEMPATYTEMMYEPEVFGQTGSVQVEVK